MKERNIVLILMLTFGVIAGVAGGQVEVVKINFEQEGATTPAGYIKDYGLAFTAQNGFEYGFDVDIFETRNRDSGNSPDERYDSINHLQKTTGRYWEIALDPGVYNIFLVCGEPTNNNMIQNIDLEGRILMDPDGEPAGMSYDFDEFTVTNLSVTDGRLTLKPAAGAVKTKLCFIDIYNADPTFNPPPSVDAGPDQAGYTNEAIQLDGTVTDADPKEGDPGTLSFNWVKRSGPGTATFDPADTTDVEDPTVSFDAAGVYELMLQATDGDKDANDVVSILVLEPQLVGHWKFDGDALDYGDNDEKSDGTLVGRPGGMPVYTAGAIGSAIDLTDVLGLEATDNHDPNLPHVALGAATELDFGITDWTVCGWVKTTQVQSAGQDDQVGKGTIFGNGGDSGGGHRYCLIVSEGGGGRVTLVVDADSNGGKFTTQTSSSRLVNNDLWHFMVGVREGNEIRVYRDGILDNTNDNLPAGYDLSGTSQVGSYIGVITDWDSDPLLLTIYKHLDGLVDDVRVYNYALSDEDIVALAGMSELPVSVDAGSDEPHQLKPGETISTAATVIDNGTPGTRNYLWETVARPADSNAIFGDKTAENTTVEFPDFGTYTLRLTVEDVNLGIFVSDEVTLEIISPTCADVITEDLLLDGDISGPNGEPDCRVDGYDFAEFAAYFMRCNDPQGAACEDAWNGG